MKDKATLSIKNVNMLVNRNAPMSEGTGSGATRMKGGFKLATSCEVLRLEKLNIALEAKNAEMEAKLVEVRGVMEAVLRHATRYHSCVDGPYTDAQNWLDGRFCDLDTVE